MLSGKFTLGLFEDPYVDVEAAEKVMGNAAFQAKADLALRKSIVLLRNDTKTLPLKPKMKLYFESYYKTRGAAGTGNVYTSTSANYPVEFMKTPEEADRILLGITPGSKSLFESDGGPLELSLSKNAVDVDYINGLTAQKPTILAINYTNPWVIDEIYNKDT